VDLYDEGSEPCFALKNSLIPAEQSTVEFKEALNKSFDKPVLSRVEGLRTNGKVLIPLVVSLSNALLSLSKGTNGIHLFRALLTFTKVLATPGIDYRCLLRGSIHSLISVAAE
jgi:hypothetical protein